MHHAFHVGMRWRQLVAIDVSSIGDLLLSSLNDNKVNGSVEEEDVEGCVILEFKGLAEALQTTGIITGG